MPKLERMVSVAVWPPEVTKTATKPSPEPLQEHSLDSCTVKLVPVGSVLGQLRYRQLLCGLLSCSICPVSPSRTSYQRSVALEVLGDNCAI